MIYLIFGEEKYLVNKKLDSIINANKDASISKFDAFSEQFDYNEVIFSCKNIDLFANKTLIIVRDPLCLIKKIESSSVNNLINYCLDPCYDSDLIFYSINYNFNERLKTYKDIKANAQEFKFNKVLARDYYQYAQSLLNEYHLDITKDVKNLLIGNPNMSFDILKNNLEVLSLYPGKIDLDAVKKLITYADEEEVYNLINSIVDKDMSSSLIYARRIIELTKETEPVPGLIGLLATKLRFIYNVSYYDSIGKNKDEICDILNCKYATPVTKAYESLSHFDQKGILKLITKLSDLDYQIKSNNNIDSKEALEMFIVGIINE